MTGGATTGDRSARRRATGPALLRRRGWGADEHRALFEEAADAIVVASAASGCVEAANARAAVLFGRAPETVSGLGLPALFDARTAATLARLAGGGGPVLLPDAEAHAADGTARPVSVSATVVTVGERRLLHVAVRDERQRRRTETELIEARRRLEAQNAELRAAQERLLEIDRVRSEFLGMMSHELRTPVNIIIGYAHMLLESVAAGDPLSPEERAGILRRMVAGGHTLSELVEDTLSVLRLDAGVVRLELEPLALDSLFHDLKGNDRLLRGQDAVEERWSVEPDVPEIVTDRRKLRQVITNLVGNARKFTKTGYIDVKAALAGPNRVRISVTDTGCGIDAEHLPNVFELYRQAPSGQAHDGCGIGLYIVRRYVEMLQGSVMCASTVGVGSTFTIDLPVRSAATAVAVSRAGDNGHAGAA
jgi:signal transduction histidine kinase